MQSHNYITNCNALCIHSGCQYDKTSNMLAQARTIQHETESTLAKHKEQNMGYALWCDQGEHAFASTDRHHSLTVKSTDDEGNYRTEEKTVCNKHMEVVQRSMLPKGSGDSLP